MDTAQKKQKTFRGTVVSTAMQDTAVVEVRDYKKHRKYGKYVTQRKKYTVHDPGNTTTVGQTVTIQECRPVSKTKRFKITGHDTDTQAQTNDTK